MADVTFEKIARGEKYTRDELVEIWGYEGKEALSRGVVTPKGTNKIILFVTVENRKVDEPYENRLAGGTLQWEGPHDHYAEARMLAARQNGEEIHLFHRELDRSPFTYEGLLTLKGCDLNTDKPSRFIFHTGSGEGAGSPA